MADDTVHSDWEPPQDPDPEVILDEAVQDTQQGDYETALAKFVWFHEHALEYEPALAGVRLSFALAYWLALSKRYQAAMDTLLEIRDRAKAKCLASGFEFHVFHELAGINHALGDSGQTVEVFLAAHETAPDVAQRIYHVAQHALISNERYDICNDYINADKSIEHEIQAYEVSHKWESENSDAPPFARHHLEQRVTTLIALLVINGRTAEAEQAAARVRQVIDDAEMSQKLDDALAGNLPGNWP